MGSEFALLDAARRMPEAANLLRYVGTDLYEFWRDVLRLEIDHDKFTAKYLRAAQRFTVDGITLQDLALATVIEDSTALALDHGQRMTLRADVARINRELLAAIKRERLEEA